MKSKSFLLGIFLLILFSSFKSADSACEYLGSNIAFIASQTQKALSQTDFNKTKFEVYKAINAIEKSKIKIKDCDCSYATKNLMKALEHLVNSTKISTIDGAKIFLNKALESTNTSLELLQQHHTHRSKYKHDELSLNIKIDNEEKASRAKDNAKLRQTIDQSLKNFEVSLDRIVETNDCEEAKKYFIKVQKNGEKELLNEKLSEGKKYFNFRTKAIATAALKKLDCYDPIFSLK